MAMNLEDIFSKKVDYLMLRQKKLEVIAGNIANADTPGYKATGVEFSSLLKSAKQVQSIKMTRTNEQHMVLDNTFNNNIGYRIPTQPDTGDGNTVDVAKERNLFLKNSLEYQYGLRSIDGTIKGIKKAINGGK